MSLQFLRAKPLQAGKLAAIVAVIVYALAGVYGVVIDAGLMALFAVVLLGFGLALTLVVETLVAGYRGVEAEASIRTQLGDRPLYSIVRGIEGLSLVLWAGGFLAVIAILPEEAPEGPGAIGALFLVVGVSLVIIVGSLVRTLVEVGLVYRTAGE
jgi:hypothetical protein